MQILKKQTIDFTPKNDDFFIVKILSKFPPKNFEFDFMDSKKRLKNFKN